MQYSAIILCAGKGSRTGLSYNKILHRLEDKTIYETTIDTFIKDPQCQQIIIVTKKEEVQILKSLVSNSKIEYVFGGKERQDSVYAGLTKVKEPYVLIHDGARPFIEKKQIDAVLTCLKEHHACVLMIPCIDTVKEVKDGKVVRTLARDTLFYAQTPQAFFTKTIIEAHQQAQIHNVYATDDSALIEKFTKEEVYVVVGDERNKKITTPADIKGTGTCISTKKI